MVDVVYSWHILGVLFNVYPLIKHSRPPRVLYYLAMGTEHKGVMWQKMNFGGDA